MTFLLGYRAYAIRKTQGFCKVAESKNAFKALSHFHLTCSKSATLR
jgi:hypothetical protein